MKIAHSVFMVKVIIVCVYIKLKYLNADSDDSDQTARMRSELSLR